MGKVGTSCEKKRQTNNNWTPPKYEIVEIVHKVRLELRDISNTRDSVSSGYSNTAKIVENMARGGVFLTQFEVFRC